MKKSLLFCTCMLLMVLGVIAQPPTQLMPTATEAKVILALMSPDRIPVSNATLKVANSKGLILKEGKTDAKGNWECLLPINQTYELTVGDSVAYNQFTVSNRPGLVMKHSTFFVGWIDGKFVGGGKPINGKVADGYATLNLHFKGLKGEPLVNETATLTADLSKKAYQSTTDAAGIMHFRVPIGESYTLALPYREAFQQFEFPKDAHSYDINLKYVYAGKVAIERMRAERLAAEQRYDAYLAMKKEEQFKYRDANGHKKIFNATAITPSAPPFKVNATAYGFSLNAEQDSPFESPYYYDGMLIAGACWSSNELAAVNAKTGQAMWAVRLAESGVSNIEGSDDVIVCTTESCTIYAIAARTGKLLWSKWLASYVLSAPCIADGRVYIGYEDHAGSALGGDAAKGRGYAMACFDLKTGAIVWQQWIDGEVMSSAVASGNNLYFNTFAGVSYILDRKTGATIAEKKLFATSAPTVAGGHVYMGQRDALNRAVRERIAAFDATTLELLHATTFQDAPYLDVKATEKTQYASAASNTSLNTGSTGLADDGAQGITAESLVGTTSIFAVMSYEGSRPLYLDGKIYAAQSHVLRCLDAQTLALAWEWRYPTSLDDDGGALMAPPIAVRGRIVVACMDGMIREFAPLTGAIAKHYATGEKLRQQPIAAAGNYYAPCVNGKIAVVQTGNALVDKWYCWGGNATRNNAPVDR